MSTEQDIYELWLKVSPSAAYSGGLEEFEGKVFVPHHHAVEAAIQEAEDLKKDASHEERKFLESMIASLNFEEPWIGPAGVLGILYIHVVKEAGKESYKLLEKLCIETLDAYISRLSDEEWELPLRIMTSNKCDGAVMIIETVENEHSIDLSDLKEKIAGYERIFGSEVKGGFDEVYAQMGVSIKRRKKNYAQVLKRLYDYPEGPEEIEKKAAGWLDKEVKLLGEVRKKLADIYGCPKDGVDTELQQRNSVDKDELIPAIEKIRKPLQSIVNRKIVRIKEGYDTRLQVTPPYLRAFIPTAAMQSFDGLTTKPFNIFFTTPNEFQNFVDLMQTTTHEEYGHSVNFSNSARDGEGLRILDSSLEIPITEGISFQREVEALDILRNLGDEKDEKELREIIEDRTDMDTFLLEYEYVVRKWRVTRFVRAIYDVRVNQGTPIKDFIDEMSDKTSLPKKWLYNQTFGVHTPPGYLPAYCIVGQRVADMQAAVKEKGKDVREFNTLACSMGFPAQTVWEEELRVWMNG